MKESLDMNKIRKVQTALLNQAIRDPGDYDFATSRGEMVTVTHKETGTRLLVDHLNPICVMGAYLDSWANHNDLYRLESDGEYIEAWSRFNGK